MKQIFVKLPNGEVEIGHIREMYKYYKNAVFTSKNWKHKAALVEKVSGTKWLYVGQKFDSKYIELVEDGWTHDHCEFCFKTITASNNESDKSYFNPNDEVWICKNCFETFLLAHDIEEVLTTLTQKQP